MQLLNSASFRRMEQAAYATEVRQNAINHNIANAQTPGFKRSDVKFEELLKQAIHNERGPKLAGTMSHEKHIAFGKRAISAIKPQVSRITGSSMNIEENNVDAEREHALLAQNQMAQSLYVGQISHEVKMMRIAIEGRA